jgi:hypothetical protein
MFRRNDHHLQWPLLSDLDALPPKLKKRLEASWAGTFYREIFVRLDEKPFAVLYWDEASRPNIPINVLVGLETLKAGFGWSDEEMDENFCFDLQVRYALGYRQLGEGHFELRTMYNFRHRLSEHMQTTGEDLLAQAFAQVTDEQVVAFGLKTNKLRMDSTQIASNIRQYSRLQLLVEVLQRVQRDLSEADQQTYAPEFAAYLKGSSGQYVYRVKPEAYASHLEQIGQVMHKLVLELAAAYAAHPSYQMLVRVFNEHFIIAENEGGDDEGLRPRQGQELSAASLQSPDDGVASYRQKHGQDFTGYVANLAETCHSTNPFQLIVDLQTEPNTTDDAAMLAESLPSLKERTGLDEMHTDGGYNSPEVDQVMRQYQVEQVQTAIRGRQANPAKLNLDDFIWEVDPQGQPLALTAPTGQRTDIEPGRQPDRYIARFNPPPPPASSPPASATPATKPAPPPVWYFSQQQLDLALRRQRSAQARTEGSNLRVAIEATVGAVKRPFNNDQLPVRGPFRVKMMVWGSAFMVNLRRIHRYQTVKNHQKGPDKGQEASPNPSFSLPFGSQIPLLISHLASILCFSPVHW